MKKETSIMTESWKRVVKGILSFPAIGCLGLLTALVSLVWLLSLGNIGGYTLGRLDRYIDNLVRDYL